jgi:hypothetical protein
MDPNSKVHQLINWEMKWWDHEKLVNLFMKEEVAVIKTIPISHTNQPDCQIWRCTGSGIFSVKSAYHLAKELEDRKTPESLNQVKDSPLWKMIWKLPIQNVAKNFFWRACHNLLPTKDNLLRKKVVKDPFCPICEKDPETILHALWECPAAMDVWGVGKKAFQKVTYNGGEFWQLAEFMMNRFEEEDFGMFIQLTRQIWLRRNTWLYEGTFTSPNDIVNATANYAEDFKLANEKPIPKIYVNENGQDEKWTAPTHGWYKANWDFAFDNSAGRMGFGVIVRDKKGEVAVAWSKSCLGSL